MSTTVSVSTLQASVAYALRYDPSARARIERAAVLIALGAVEKVDETAYRVASQTGDGTTYTVTPDHCECVDRRRHPSQRCKHEWAVRLVIHSEFQERKAESDEHWHAQRGDHEHLHARRGSGRCRLGRVAAVTPVRPGRDLALLTVAA